LPAGHSVESGFERVSRERQESPPAELGAFGEYHLMLTLGHDARHDSQVAAVNCDVLGRTA
jgi:hypothetical protein